MKTIEIYGYEGCPYYQNAITHMTKKIGTLNKIVVGKTTFIQNDFLKCSYTPVERGKQWEMILNCNGIKSHTSPIVLISRKLIIGGCDDLMKKSLKKKKSKQ